VAGRVRLRGSAPAQGEGHQDGSNRTSLHRSSTLKVFRNGGQRGGRRQRSSVRGAAIRQGGSQYVLGIGHGTSRSEEPCLQNKVQTGRTHGFSARPTPESAT
jgi:hypothetical protein